jgi:hypothetical protein
MTKEVARGPQIVSFEIARQVAMIKFFRRAASERRLDL